MIDDYLRIGSIVKPHGLKGAVKVYPTTDDSNRFNKASTAYIRTGSKDIKVTIKSSSAFKNLWIVTFNEFSDINDIEGFKGCDLIIEKDAERDLSDGEYYVDDLIDMEVSDEEGNVLGRLTEVIVTGANDVYVVKNEDREILIPAIDDCIKEVEVEEKRMKVHLLSGL